MIQNTETQEECMEKNNPEAVGISSSRLNQVNRLVESYINSSKIPGAITLIARRNKVVHFECYGKMDIEANKPMQEDTIFRIYSMTKPVTTVAMMMLYEQGYFQLDTPVSAFIPQFKDLEVFKSGTVENYSTVKPQREMIIADLLSHTSGLSYNFMNTSPVDAMYRAVGIQGSSTPGTLQQLIDKLSRIPLLFSPGSQWCYSLSTEVVGYLVQIISGMRLDEFVKKYIALPLEMTDTNFYVPQEKHDRFAALYTHADLVPTSNDVQPKQPLILIDSPQTGRYSAPRTFLSGGGGLVSTASDYYNFLTMLLNKGNFKGNQLLSPKTVDLMTTNHLPGDIASLCVPGTDKASLAGMGFGLGFAIMLDPTKAHMLGSPGEYNWWGLANTSFFVDPKEELIAMFLTQLHPSTVYNIRKEFRVAVYQAIVK